MKKYDNYKDSGIEWIGEIPSHWGIGKLKFYCEKITDGSHHSPPTLEQGKRYLSVKDIGNNELLFEDCKKISEEEFKLLVRNGCQPKKDDILLTKDGTIGRAAIVGDDNDFVVLSSLGIIRPNQIKLDNVFLREWLVSNLNVDQMLSLIQGSALTRITITIINNLIIPIPPLDEQFSIANFLDQKTTQIDDLIAKKARLIKLLDEERTAIINQAVTKGLDPSVPMKDSGVEWLGEIPTHWEVKSFRFCIDILTDYTANGSFASLAENVTYYDTGYSRLVRLTDLRVDLVNEGLYVDEHAHNFLKKSELFGGEILIANVGAYAGLVMQMPLKEGKFTLGPNMFLVRLNQNTEFFLCQLNAPFCAEQLKMMSVSSAQPKLNKENIRQLKVVTPPIEEQNLIANHILQEKNRIETIAVKTQQEIELLKEYKTALISEVVTGKVDVRNWQPMNKN